MKKILGILGLLASVVVLTAILNPQFLGADNLENTLQRTSLFAILSIGVAFVIITGGIDLSIGSVVGLVGTLLPWLLREKGWPVGGALAAVAAVSLAIGLAHGLLITKLRLQPFVVTLCGLLIYRGIARGLTKDQSQGFGNEFQGLKYLADGAPLRLPFTSLDVPMPFLLMAAIAVGAAVFLNRTVWGRYLLALGRNEQAARYSGIETDRLVITAYVICSLLSGLGGTLFALYLNSVQPASTGNFYELYAIAAAVLGGCSLRGGEGSILGVVLGAAVIRVLYNSINMLTDVLRISTQIEYLIIGLVLLGGVVADELVKRFVARRRARIEAGRHEEEGKTIPS